MENTNQEIDSELSHLKNTAPAGTRPQAVKDTITVMTKGHGVSGKLTNPMRMTLDLINQSISQSVNQAIKQTNKQTISQTNKQFPAI